MGSNFDWDDLRQQIAEPLPQPDLQESMQVIHLVQQWFLQREYSPVRRGMGKQADPTHISNRLCQNFPSQPQQFAQVFQQFLTDIEPYAYRIDHPLFVGFVPGAPSIPSIVGDWVTAVCNFFGGVWVESSAPTAVELQILELFHQWLGMPPETSGLLTGGGSEANLIALIVARDQQEFADRPRLRLYVSEQRHWSLDRAARIIGLHTTQIVPIAVDARFRLSVPHLQRAIEADLKAGHLPWVVAANAGSTNTGAVDPLGAIADLCHHHQIWLHVDAAYGWLGILAPTASQHFAGIDRIDSITLDPHKWFAQTYDVGCLLVRQGMLLERTFANHPDYMQDVIPKHGEVNFADRGIALTRRCRALKIWFSLMTLGTDWFRRLANHCCQLAQYSAELLLRAGFTIIAPPTLSIVCFRYHPEDQTEEVLEQWNRKLCQAIQQSETAFLSSTNLDNKFTLRVCFVNWRTTAADVEALVDLLVHFQTIVSKADRMAT
ncbi:MAG: aminotransferase class V-fold PLP-dependent enzyme [Zavarzinella sp.]